jgi:hypothetical protein
MTSRMRRPQEWCTPRAPDRVTYPCTVWIGEHILRCEGLLPSSGARSRRHIRDMREDRSLPVPSSALPSVMLEP